MKAALEVLREFFVLGLTAFGGPTAHVAFFRDRFVGIKKWLSDSDFADLLALCQFLPGPASSQLGLCIGWRRAGLPGAFAAWTAFTLPSALALTIFAVILLNFGGEGIDGSAGWLRGLQIAVVAVIAKAVVSMWTTLCPDKPRQLMALIAAGVILATGPAWMQIVVIVVGALIGFFLLRIPEKKSVPEEGGETTDVRTGSKTVGAVCLGLFAVLLVGLIVVSNIQTGQPLGAFSAMYRSGALVFGGGHVVLPLLSEEVVNPGWVSREEFLAGYGAAQAVPGPLFTFSSFLGAMIEGPGGPWLMSLIALVGIFLPAWLLVLGVMPFWTEVVKKPGLRRALAGTNAAVVGILGAALYDPVWTGAIESGVDVVFLIGVAAALLVLKLPSWLVVILAGACAEVLSRVVG